MPETPTVQTVVEQVVARATSEREKAVALHDYMRERVKFGFSKYFDAGTPDDTLACGIGYCNTKSPLLVALFRAAGLESFTHFVVISKDILRGAMPASRHWMVPAEISHAYVEVKVEGRWCAIESHIVDTPLLQAALARLAAEGLALGYAVRLGATNAWDGRSDVFVQSDPHHWVEDHGRVEDLDEYFRSRKYRNQMLGVTFNTVFKLMGEAGVAPINAHIERIRQSSVSAPQARAQVPFSRSK
ncbi:MAG: transglutaminase domain-containing protein [Anaerolineales bacterium]|nr:transglutaminase domain-containing protein [Anaerolineales bacterium]